jgi:hypothetical protein
MSAIPPRQVAKLAGRGPFAAFAVGERGRGPAHTQ